MSIILGVTSSIAAYKSLELVSKLLKRGLDVEVIMSENATNFVTPECFSALTKHKTITKTFDKNIHYEVEHISLAKKAEVFALVPATANVIAKIAHGLADDMLTTTFLAADCPKLVAPAMNTKMYENMVTQDNLALLKKYGIEIIEPSVGHLACGDTGRGHLADIDDIEDAILQALCPKPLKGQKIVVTAGPTKEKIDPVRFISNHSSGKMGIALAHASKHLGAEVTLLLNRDNDLRLPYGIKVERFDSVNDLFELSLKHFAKADGFLMCAAVSDYRVKNYQDEKIKKEAELHLELEKTRDILSYLGAHKKQQKLCGFAMETSKNDLAYAYEKFEHKNCDLLVLNNLKEEGAGFKGDTNIVTLIDAKGHEKLELALKEELGFVIVKRLMGVE